MGSGTKVAHTVIWLVRGFTGTGTGTGLRLRFVFDWLNCVGYFRRETSYSCFPFYRIVADWLSQFSFLYRIVF